MQLTDELRDRINALLTTPPDGTPVDFDNRIGRGGCRGGAGWKSAALGVSPDQIPETMEYLRASGVPTEFSSDGDAIVTGDRHAKRIAKASGMFDGRHGYVTRHEDGSPIFTGTEPAKRKQHFAENARKYAAGEPCDPQVARKIEKLAETV